MMNRKYLIIIIIIIIISFLYPTILISQIRGRRTSAMPDYVLEPDADDYFYIANANKSRRLSVPDLLSNTYYPDATEIDQGLTGSNNTIKYAVDTISSDEGVILLRHNSGNANTEYILSTNETIPSNIILKIEPGAYIDGNATLTINGPLEASLTKCFDPNNLTISWGNKVNKLYPEWFGADPTNTNDSSLMIYDIIVSANGKTIEFQGEYDVSTLGNYSITKNLSLIGIKGCKLDGKDNETASIEIGGDIDIDIRNISFEDFGYVLSTSDPNNYVQDLIFKNNIITSSEQGIFLRCDVKNAIIEGNKFSDLSNTDYYACAIWLGQNVYSHQTKLKKFIINNNEIFNLNTSHTGYTEAHGIIVYGQEAIITNNIIEDIINSDDGSNAEGIYTKCRRVVISNNNLTNAGTGQASINIKGSLRGTTSTPNGFGVICCDNILYSDANVYTGIHTEQEDVLIANNYLEGFGDNAIDVALISPGNVTVTGNKIRNHAGAISIYCKAEGSGLTFSNNHIYNFSGDRSIQAIAVGIYIYAYAGNMNDIIVADNYIYDLDTNATTNAIGIFIQAKNGYDIDNISITGNKCNIKNDSITEYGIYASIDANSTITDLIISDNEVSEVDDNQIHFGINAAGTLLRAKVVDNVGGDETLTTASPTLHWWGYTELDTSNNDITGTLPDAYYIGQTKTIVLTDATEAGDGGTTISATHHVTSDPEVCTFDAVDETWILQWTGTEWITLYNSCTL